MVTNRIFYIILLICSGFLYIFTNTYYTLSLLLLVIILPVVSLILMLISARSITVNMSIPPSTEKGEVSFSLDTANKGMIPVAKLIISLALENQLMGVSSEKHIYMSISSKKEKEVFLQVENAKIGVLSINVKKTKIYDIFGLFSKKLATASEKSTIVYPRLLEMEIYMDRPVETSGDGSRYSTEKKGMDNSEIFAIRDYSYGDEIRKIHWKLSGKVDKIVVRDFSLPLNYSIFLLIELSKTDEQIMDAMMELYLSLSRVLLYEGINHNLAWYNDGEEKLHVHELDTLEDFEVAMAEFLMSYAPEDKSAALNHYTESNFNNNESTLIYISADPDTEKITEIEMSQRIKTVYVTNQKDITEIDNIEVYSVNPEHIKEGLPKFII